MAATHLKKLSLLMLQGRSGLRHGGNMKATDGGGTLSCILQRLPPQAFEAVCSALSGPQVGSCALHSLSNRSPQLFVAIPPLRRKRLGTKAASQE